MEQVANADHGAESVVGETLQMVDEILAREVLLCHCPIDVVLISDVAVQIDLRRHHGLAGQIDTHRPGWRLHLASPADSRELTILDDERGVLDGHAAVTRNEPRSLANCGAWRL